MPHRLRLRMLRVVALVLASTWVVTAGAEEPARPSSERRWLEQLDVQAGRVEADLRLRELSLSGDVQVRLDPYYLRSDRLVLSATPWGVDVQGSGYVSFCGCADPPLAIGFAGGWAAPPHSLIVRHPTLRVFGLPVFWLPYLWLRSPQKIGFGVPEVSFRGADGLFVGDSLHLPLAGGLDLAGGGYVQGGGMGRVSFRTTSSRSSMVLDVRPESDGRTRAGLQLDARGRWISQSTSSASMAWDIDMARGPRALRTLIELDALARPHDRAEFEARWGAARTGVSLVDRRAGPVDRMALITPYLGAAWAGSWLLEGTHAGANVATSFGPRVRYGSVSDVVLDGSLAWSLARALGSVSASLHWRSDVRAGRVVDHDDPWRPEVSLSDRNGSRGQVTAVHELAAEFGLPLGRPVGLSPDKKPRAMAVLEPIVRARGVVTHGRDDGRVMAGWIGQAALASATSAEGRDGAVLVTAGLRSILRPLVTVTSRGNPGRLSTEIDAGVLSTSEGTFGIAGMQLNYGLRARDGAQLTAQLQGAGTQALVSSPLHDAAQLGYVALARLHWEAQRRLVGVEAWTAFRGNVPVLGGWSILDRSLAANLRVPTGLSTEGVNVGLALGVPLGSMIRVGGDAEVFASQIDFTDLHWIAWRGRFRYAHPCGCMRLHLRAGQVLGREGWDVLADLELVRSEPRGPLDL